MNPPKNTSASRYKSVALLLIALFAVGCGGGGGTPEPQPSACAGVGFVPAISYPTLSASIGSAVNLSPQTNIPAACAGAVSYAIGTGVLPTGLSLNPTTGVISGIPTGVQSSSFSVTTNVAGYSAVTSAPISASVIGCSGNATFVPSLTYPASLTATAGIAINPLLPTSNVAASCAGNAVYSVAGGVLPAGLSLNSSTGVISGAFNSAQTSTLGVQLTVNGYPVAASPTITANVTAPAGSATVKNWTMMVYIAGDNNLAGFAIEDLNELKAASTNPNVNIVVQVEKGRTYANTGFVGNPGTSTYRGLVNGINTVLSDIGNVDMGNPTTLSNFISWSKMNHPAQNYSLVLWSHGGGWKTNKASRGALQDESAGTFMSLANIRSGVTTGMGAGNKLAVLTFDACQMGQYEVAYELRSTASYLVASEENVPGPGMPYTQVVNLLSNAPMSSPQVFATGMANAFSTSYAALSRESTTMSVTDLVQMDNVHTKVLDFSSQAKAALTNQAAVLNGGRLGALTFGGGSAGDESIDLWRYADYVTVNATGNTALQASATELKASINTAVITNTSTGQAMVNAKGMAVYFPKIGSQYNSALYRNSTLSNVAAAGKTTWNDYLTALYAGSSYTTSAVGDFAYYMTWTNPPGIKVDIDLAMKEPRGNWATAAAGSTSPNGFLSGDSYLSNQNFESYTAASNVESGAYDLFANLYGCYDANNNFVSGTACTTRVTLCEKTGGSANFVCRAPVMLDRGRQNLDDAFYSADPQGTLWTTVTNNATSPYYDWYYFGQVRKSLSAPKGKVKQQLLRTKHKRSGV